MLNNRGHFLLDSLLAFTLIFTLSTILLTFISLSMNRIDLNEDLTNFKQFSREYTEQLYNESNWSDLEDKEKNGVEIQKQYTSETNYNTEKLELKFIKNNQEVNLEIER